MREDTIEICHLKKAYGEHVIFSNLTMELKKGAVTCLMAPSGAGKTTLLRILAGLEQADGGAAAVKALVLTCSQFPDVTEVKLQVEGEDFVLDTETLAVTTVVNTEQEALMASAIG